MILRIKFILLFIILCAHISYSQSSEEVTTETVSVASNPLYELYKIKKEGEDNINLALPCMTPKAFFCRLEHQSDKLVLLKTRFRLGSIDQVNFLEQKTSYTVQIPEIKKNSN